MDGSILAQLAVLVFVIGSMGNLGLNLTVEKILTPLKDLKLIGIALALNFIVAPLLGWGLAALFALDVPLTTGLILLTTAAGAPFAPKLVEVAKGDVAASVAVMVLLMVVTVLYLPLVLPLLLTGVAVDAWAIAQSLIFLMLMPLAVGLFIAAYLPKVAALLQPPIAQASNVALILLVVLGLVMNFSSMIGLIGSRGLIAGALFVAALVLIGLLVGGEKRSVVGLASGQRNISAALVVAGQNFGSDVLTYVLALSLLSLIILFPAAELLGRKASASSKN